MRIAFDLDDTLIPSLAAFPVEDSASHWLRPTFRERLRRGTVPLLRDLLAEGHEVWVYTTSMRSPLYLKLWFRAFGVRLSGVVNGQRHAEWERGGTRLRCSKYPPAFGIDLLIDDSAGVEREGREHGFAVHRVDAADASWVEGVRRAVAEGKR